MKASKLDKKRFAVLTDERLMAQLTKSEEALKRGEVRSFEEVRRELSI